jgi:quinol monooxygenase YgiN
MSILQCRSAVRAKDGKWDEAQSIAAKMATDANTRPGTIAYEIYLDESAHQLINIAAYRDADAWLAHTKSNPFSREYMSVCDLVSLEVHGDPPPDLLAMIKTFGNTTIYPALAHD